MDVKTLLKEKKEHILTYATTFFAEKKEDWKQTNEWGPDSLNRLLTFIQEGKMVRGSFVLWTAELLGKKEEDALPVALAMECLQAALLAHDDIMDDDVLRRGMPTLHEQYAQLSQTRPIEQKKHFGVSMAICVGDLALFLAYELLAKTNDAQLIGTFSKHISLVGLGQMQDVYWGMSTIVPEAEDILRMYEQKTAVYTFSLPFLLGGQLAGANPQLQEDLDMLGKLMGKLFQIKDDELGLYSDDDTLGKTTGLDILSAKKTLHYVLLLSRMSKEEQERLLRIQQQQTFLAGDKAFVAEILVRHDIQQTIQTQVDDLLAQARKLIATMNLPTKGKELLELLLLFILERTT
jgi:geranylgeranyl diphosphate synthase type I